MKRKTSDGKIAFATRFRYSCDMGRDGKIRNQRLWRIGNDYVVFSNLFVGGYVSISVLEGWTYTRSITED